jgi:hypothetical protein
VGFRFQRRVSTPFGRINLSKSGVSLTEGVRGAHITIGRTPRVTVGLPGSGLSYTQTFGRRRSSSGLAVIGWVAFLLFVLAIFGGH